MIKQVHPHPAPTRLFQSLPHKSASHPSSTWGPATASYYIFYSIYTQILSEVMSKPLTVMSSAWSSLEESLSYQEKPADQVLTPTVRTSKPAFHKSSLACTVK